LTWTRVRPRLYRLRTGKKTGSESGMETHRRGAVWFGRSAGHGGIPTTITLPSYDHFNVALVGLALPEAVGTLYIMSNAVLAYCGCSYPSPSSHGTIAPATNNHLISSDYCGILFRL